MFGNIRVISAILLCPQSAQGIRQLSEVTRPSYLHGGHRLLQFAIRNGIARQIEIHKRQLTKDE